MRVLLVEDDEDKRLQLATFVDENLKWELVEARSFQSALKALKADKFDLVILDMTIPTFDITPTDSGGRSQAFGGEMLLFEMVRREIETRAIVVTQFDKFGEGDKEVNLKDLDQRLASQFNKNYLGVVQYGTSYVGWSDALFQLIKDHR